MNMPLVSVVVATYRREESLRKALKSLNQQIYSNIEIVLVDDNDDFNWNQVVQRIAEEVWLSSSEMKRKLIVNHPNLGSAKARNVGIEAAEGEYITFLDDDDIYLPEKISKQVNAMLNSEADYSITDLNLYSEKDKLINKRVRSYIISPEKNELLKYHLMYHMTGTDTMMFRAGYLKKIGGFPPINVGDEFYLMVEAINGGGKFHYLPGCDVKAYVHSEGGLSSGEGKIEGENDLYQYKQAFFSCVDAKSRRYIRMRHYAVLAFAELRRMAYFTAMIQGMKSFICAPLACINMLTRR